MFSFDLKRKRKWDDPTHEVVFQKPEKINNNEGFEFAVQYDTPLPLEWQRCLDIKSGQVYFYNARTQKKTFVDPRSTQEPPNEAPAMSLDLELNLPFQPSTTKQAQKSYKIDYQGSHHDLPAYSCSNIQFMNLCTASKEEKPLARSPSRLTFNQGEHQEMVTAVCKKCYMLVLMCKSAGKCPNCKFVHPSEPSLNMFNQRCSLML